MLKNKDKYCIIDNREYTSIKQGVTYMNTETRNNKINAIRNNIGKVLVGKEKLTDLILTAIIAEGHVLQR